MEQYWSQEVQQAIHQNKKQKTTPPPPPKKKANKPEVQ
jgi:hypothetical protein